MSYFKKYFIVFLSLVFNTVQVFAQEIERELTIDQKIDESFSGVSKVVADIVLYSVSGVPIIVVWLFLGAIFCTVYFGFVNIRSFKLAIDIVTDKFDDGKKTGEVSHFQALTTALSGTVGLGNIAGVAAAISLGGPGATFWMIVAGFLGMSSKFVECTLGVKYRDIDTDGTVHGGPMYYLSKGFAEKGLVTLGKVLAFVFAVFCVFGSFGGGNMFQANQSFQQISTLEAVQGTWFAHNAWFFGTILAVLVAVVIIGGIKSIANVTDKLVPGMVMLYVGASIIILITNFSKIPDVFSMIFEGAFAPKAVAGGIVGVMIIGIKRAAFSNEAGVGSASIAHSAVKTDNPVSEGIVALLEPFIDTVVICTMTALVLIITGFHDIGGRAGIELTSAAYESELPGAQYIIMICAVMFAFSTMISWSYYGLQAWEYLFGKSKRSELIYKAIFCLMIIVGAASSMNSVIDFSDCMILAMSFPNFIGMYLLMPNVKKEYNAFLAKIKSGEIKRK